MNTFNSNPTYGCKVGSLEKVEDFHDIRSEHWLHILGYFGAKYMAVKIGSLKKVEDFHDIRSEHWLAILRYFGAEPREKIVNLEKMDQSSAEIMILYSTNGCNFGDNCLNIR